jgi:hypothetical protein
MAEVLLDVAQNASIRGMRVDGVELFSVLDFLSYVCPERTSNNVKVMWHRLENEMSSDVVTKCNHLKFNGKGQRNTPCMTILGLQKLLLILGSKAAVEFRDRVLECFNRVLAGDRSLIREIEANAARDGPVQQIARAALAEQAEEEVEDRAGGGSATGERMELELAERRLELKHILWSTNKQHGTPQICVGRVFLDRQAPRALCPPIPHQLVS